MAAGVREAGRVHLLRNKRSADHRAHPATLLRRPGHSRQRHPRLPVVQFRQRRQVAVRVERAPGKGRNSPDCGRQVPEAALCSPRQTRDVERGQKGTGPHDVPGLRLKSAMRRGGHGGEADGVLPGRRVSQVKSVKILYKLE